MDIDSNRIVNVKSKKPYSVYCGRANKSYNLPESKWANPYVIGRDGDRETVIVKYEEYIKGKPELLKDLPELKDKVLACWCDYPAENCHCSVLLKLLEEIEAQKPEEPVKIDEGFVGANLLRYNKEQIYCLLDFETSGLNLLDSKPWQLSFMVFTLDKILETHDYFIHWDNLNMSEGAARVTRFNMDFYKSRAKPLTEVLPIFEKFYLDNSILKISHNGLGYDQFIHNIARKSLGLAPTFDPAKYSIDTLALSRAYRLGVKPPKFQPGSLEWLKFSYKMLAEYGNKKLKVSLNAMCKEFNILTDESQLHNSLYDIGQNREVFKQLLWKLEI